MNGAQPISLITLLIAIGLTLPRALVALLLLPFLSRSLFGGILRSVTAFALCLLAVPATYMQIAPLKLNLLSIVFLVPKEMLVGAVIGWLTGVPFWISAMVGRVIDIQRGSLAASLFTPLFRDATSPLGTLLSQAVSVLFFTTTGITLFLGALYHSYAVWPVWGWTPIWREGGEMVIVAAFQNMLYWTLVLSAPALIVIFLIDMLMGVLNRFVPELNVFFLSFPFKGLAALLALVLYAGIMMNTFSRQFFSDPGWLLEPMNKILQ